MKTETIYNTSSTMSHNLRRKANQVVQVIINTSYLCILCTYSTKLIRASSSFTMAFSHSYDL